MKYIGSKARFSKDILPIILKNRKPEQWYVEPFAGGMNVIAEVQGNRIANDVHFYLIEMWRELVNGWIPQEYTRDEYRQIRENKEKYPSYEVGWVGFNVSYGGDYFSGFAGKTKTKIGTIRDYQTEAINNTLGQVEKMKGVLFQNKPYYELEIPSNSIVYCDPPYEGTKKYKVDEFNYEFFWNWVRTLSKQGHIVYVSEYKAPADFECIWQKAAKSSLSANGKTGSNKISVEKLFRLKNESVKSDVNQKE